MKKPQELCVHLEISLVIVFDLLYFLIYHLHLFINLPLLFLFLLHRLPSRRLSRLIVVLLHQLISLLLEPLLPTHHLAGLPLKHRHLHLHRPPLSPLRAQARPQALILRLPLELCLERLDTCIQAIQSLQVVVQSIDELEKQAVHVSVGFEQALDLL